MEVGDRVRTVYTGETGTILRIGDWEDDFNPYKIMVRIDPNIIPNNFKEVHLEVIKGKG